MPYKIKQWTNMCVPFWELHASFEEYALLKALTIWHFSKFAVLFNCRCFVNMITAFKATIRCERFLNRLAIFGLLPGRNPSLCVNNIIESSQGVIEIILTLSSSNEPQAQDSLGRFLQRKTGKRLSVLQALAERPQSVPAAT